MIFISNQRPLDTDFWVALKHALDMNDKKRRFSSQSLQELLLRDALLRLVDIDQSSFQVALNNTQSYVDLVFHQGYSADLVLCGYDR
jgi:hypothetical protein